METNSAQELRKQYEKETGIKPYYQNKDGKIKLWHTDSKYTEWLESRLQPSEVDNGELIKDLEWAHKFLTTRVGAHEDGMCAKSITKAITALKGQGRGEDNTGKMLAWLNKHIAETPKEELQREWAEIEAMWPHSEQAHEEGKYSRGDVGIILQNFGKDHKMSSMGIHINNWWKHYASTHPPQSGKGVPEMTDEQLSDYLADEYDKLGSHEHDMRLSGAKMYRDWLTAQLKEGRNEK